MKSTTSAALMLVLALALSDAASMIATQAGPGAVAAPPRPQGPCDIYGAAGTACVAAHSTTRALYVSYSGPLYQVKRQSDGATLDIGVVQPVASPVPDAGGYANAAAQDGFCANTICVVNCIYDQSGKGNHLRQAPLGPSFPGPAKGGFDTQPIADMALITIGGHKAYGVYIMPGMGFRNNDATGIAINDEAEGINDISYEHVSPGTLIDAYKAVIARAHTGGIKVFLATLLPIQNSVKDMPENLATQQAVNKWIRSGDGFDGVIDFEKVVQDPQNPLRIRADLTGDYVHPNTRGYRLMGEAIQLKMFEQ